MKKDIKRENLLDYIKLLNDTKLEDLTLTEINYIIDFISKSMEIKVEYDFENRKIKIEREEAKEYNIALDSCGYDKIQTIKYLRPITNLGLKELKDLVDSCPKYFRTNKIFRKQAENVILRLKEIGADAYIVE